MWFLWNLFLDLRNKPEKLKSVTSITTSVGDRLLKSIKHPEIIMLMEATAFHKTTPTPLTFALIAVTAGDIVYGQHIFVALVSCVSSCTRKCMFFRVWYQGAAGASSFPRVGDTWRPPADRPSRGFPSQGPFSCLQWGSWQDKRKAGTAPSSRHWVAHGDGLRPGWDVCLLAWVRNRLGGGN